MKSNRKQIEGLAKKLGDNFHGPCVVSVLRDADTDGYWIRIIPGEKPELGPHPVEYFKIYVSGESEWPTYED